MKTWETYQSIQMLDIYWPERAGAKFFNNGDVQPARCRCVGHHWRQ